MKTSHALGLGMALAALAVPGAAGADKGLGPAYDTKYRSLGIFETFGTPNGAVTVTVEEIETIDCSGCDTQYFGPGIVFHLTNNTKRPVCTALVFNARKPDGRREKWGSGTAIYLKGGKTAKKVAGHYYINAGDIGQVSVGYSSKAYVWEPNPDKTCPKVNLG